MDEYSIAKVISIRYLASVIFPIYLMQNIFTPPIITLAILLVSCVFFMNGKVRSDIVALCALLALLLFGILTPAEGLSGFSSSVVIMMVGLFIVGAGIFRTGLAKMISSRILRIGGRNENLLLVLVMVVTAVVGAFVSNTGTVAVMMPIVMSMAAAAGISARRYLMPMAFASSMGLFTLISTPPNLVIQEVIIDNGMEPLGFFAFAPVGGIIVVVGTALLFFLSRLLVVKEGETSARKGKAKTLAQLVEEYNLSHRSFRVSVPETSPVVGKTVGEMRIGSNYDVSVGRIKHTAPKGLLRSATEEVAGPDSILQAGDTLLVLGAAENVDRFVCDNGLIMDEWSPSTARESSQTGYAEAFIMPNSQLINHTVADSRFRELYNVNVLGIQRQGAYDMGDIRDIRMHSGDALLIEGEWKDITALEQYTDEFVLVGEPEKQAARVTLDRKAPIAALIMTGMITVMVFDLVPAVAAVLSAAVLMVLTGCLRNMEEAYTSINWSSIVLIAAMIPMSIAFDKTGITNAISGFLLHGLGDIGPRGLLAAVYFATSLMTMFLSNTATAVLFAPIAMDAAVRMGASPYPFLFAVAVAASMCFASPFSTPPNALVMSAGGYKFGDYIRVGLPLQVIMGVVMIFFLPLVFPFNG